MCVWSVITAKKWHGRPVDTTAKEGDVVSLGYGVSQGDM